VPPTSGSLDAAQARPRAAGCAEAQSIRSRWPRVLLICMPFMGISRPSLGISLLKAELAIRGVACDIAYLNILFAEMCGLDEFTRISADAVLRPELAIPNTALAGEWLFSQYFYGPGRLDAEGYIENVLRGPDTKVSEENIRMLRSARAIVSPFLRECLSRIGPQRYDVVGFTSTFEQNMPSLCLARMVKQASPDTIIVFGGANCEGEMGAELHRRYSFVDFVASGEADETFPALIEALREKSTTFERINGLIWRHSGRTVVNPPAGMIRDLDKLPYPDFDDYFVQLKSSPLQSSYARRVPMEASRGCWWGERSHCTFCGLNGATMAFRSKSPARVVDELCYLADRYRAGEVDFVDNILDLSYFKSVIPELIRRKSSLSLFFETKSNLKVDQIRLLSEAGVKSIQPGIESLSTDVLKLMGKGVTAIQNVQLLKWCSHFGVAAYWNLLYGFPGEDPKSYDAILEVLQCLTHLAPPTSVAPIRLDRFSPNFAEASKRGLANVRALKSYRFVYPFDDESLDRLGYFFDFEYADQRRPLQYVDPVVRLWCQWRDQGAGLLRHDVFADGTGRVVDERFTRKLRRIELDEVQNAIVLCCGHVRDRQQVLDHLRRTFLGRRFEVEAVSRFLDYLVEHRLAVREGNRYLSVMPPPDELTDGNERMDETREQRSWTKERHRESEYS